MPPDQAPKSQEQRAPLPESLKKQLGSFRARLWRVKVAEAFLAGLFDACTKDASAVVVLTRPPSNENMPWGLGLGLGLGQGSHPKRSIVKA